MSAPRSPGESRQPGHGEDRGQVLTTSRRSQGTRPVEYEFERLTIHRDFSRGFVTRMLVDRAERGGWEIHRLRVLHDGTRRVELRRRIIRQPRPTVVVG